MHDRFNALAERLGKLRITQIALHKFCTALDQLPDWLRATPIDAHRQPLLKGKTGKTPANKTASPGHQNLHACPTTLIDQAL